jgi:hypothetical protein
MCSSTSRRSACAKDPSRKPCDRCSRPRRLIALEQLHLEIARPQPDADLSLAPELHATPQQDRELQRTASAEARRLTPTFI